MNIETQREIWNNPNNWASEGHEWSDWFGTTNNLWNILYKIINPYLKGEVLEIAPGYGRITKYLLENVENLSIIDLNQLCIDKCKEKFGDKIKSYIANDGKSLNYNDNNFDFIFSFDSFVHMTSDVVECYIKEISRTLKNNGYAFIHHSFFYGGSDEPQNNIAGRANMTPELFRELVEKYNMKIISQSDFRVSEQINDTITIFQK